jgi:hypothetical protein
MKRGQGHAMKNEKGKDMEREEILALAEEPPEN